MDFAYTAAQTALAGELAALFGRFPSPPKLRAWADAGTAPFDGDLWQALADQRWLGPGRWRRQTAAAAWARTN